MTGAKHKTTKKAQATQRARQIESGKCRICGAPVEKYFDRQSESVKAHHIVNWGASDRALRASFTYRFAEKKHSHNLCFYHRKVEQKGGRKESFARTLSCRLNESQGKPTCVTHRPTQKALIAYIERESRRRSTTSDAVAKTTNRRSIAPTSRKARKSREVEVIVRAKSKHWRKRENRRVEDVKPMSKKSYAASQSNREIKRQPKPAV